MDDDGVVIKGRFCRTVGVRLVLAEEQRFIIQGWAQESEAVGNPRCVPLVDYGGDVVDLVRLMVDGCKSPPT